MILSNSLAYISLGIQNDGVWMALGRGTRNSIAENDPSCKSVPIETIAWRDLDRLIPSVDLSDGLRSMVFLQVISIVTRSCELSPSPICTE